MATLNLQFYSDNCPTRDKRFMSSGDLRNWESNNNNPDNTIKIDGFYEACNFIDVEFPNLDKKNFAYFIVYPDVIKVTKERNYYAAFIDRFEVNELNTDCFRIYYTIDWWTTLQSYYGSDFENVITKNIFGEVGRAHVNDWVQDNENKNLISCTMEYTDDTMEESVNAFHVTKQVYNQGFLKDSKYKRGIQFLYIIFKRNLLSTQTPALFVEPKIYNSETDDWSTNILPTPFGVAVIPFYHGTFIGYGFSALNLFNQDLIDYPVNTITGDEIAGMFIADFCGYEWDFNEAGVVLFNRSCNTIQFDVDGSTNKCTAIVPPSYDLTKFSNTLLSTFGANSKIYPLTSDTYKDRTTIDYDWFKENGMSKLHCEPYITNCIVSQKGGCIIHYHLVKSTDDFVVNVSPNTGGYYLGIKDVSNDGLAELRVIQAYNIFQPFSTQNWIDQSLAVFQSVSSVTTPLVSGNNTIANLHAPNKKGEVSNTAFINEGMANYTMGVGVFGGLLNSADIMRDVALGGNTQISPNYEGTLVGTSSLCGCTIEPLYQSNIDEINEHLIRYGYATYLEPYDILINHKRKYFNYIRCDTVRVTISHPQNVINSIKEMLLNGVWLFSYVDNDTIFKLDGVINMQVF